jgi:calcium-dependent protein kinase
LIGVFAYEYNSDDRNFCLITEFISGSELYETIVTWKQFDEEKANYIMAQVLGATNYLHSMNIIHRDIKPEIMLMNNKFNNKEMLNI